MKRLEHRRNFLCENNNLYALSVLNSPLDPPPHPPALALVSFNLRFICSLVCREKALFVCEQKWTSTEKQRRSPRHTHSVIVSFCSSFRLIIFYNQRQLNLLHFICINDVRSSAAVKSLMFALTDPDSRDLTHHIPLCSHLEG